MSVRKRLSPFPSANDIELAHEGKRVLRELLKNNAPCYSVEVLSSDGESNVIQLPAIAFSLLAEALHEISNGSSVKVMPQQPELTTQEAGDALNVSRPFLIKLLESGQIPFHRVGTHRRIKHKDIIDLRLTAIIKNKKPIDMKNYENKKRLK